jgi:hypothetical protein
MARRGAQQGTQTVKLILIRTSVKLSTTQICSPNRPRHCLFQCQLFHCRFWGGLPLTLTQSVIHFVRFLNLQFM